MTVSTTSSCFPVTIGGSAANTSLSGPTIASHSHNVNRANNKNAGGNHPVWDRPSGTVASGNTGGGGGHSHPLSANFSGNANSILQPYVTVIYVIKT